MTTATRTALFTDLTDYTARVSHVDREGLRRILLHHEQMVRPIVERHHGRVVKNIGDSFLCLFVAATDALRAALEILEASLEEGVAGIRLGVNTGDVEEIDGDAFGEPVNVAARILHKSPPGEAWFGAGTRVCMNDAEIPWEAVGRFRLKGLPGEHECYRLVPARMVWLPPSVEAAARSGRLVRLRPDEPVPPLPPDPVIFLEEFEPGSSRLEEAMRTLPILPAASFFLVSYRIATDDRQAWVDSGRGLVIATQAAIDTALHRLRKPAEQGAANALDSSATMVLDSRLLATVELVLCGIALPAVPFSDVIESYSYEFLSEGRWVARSERALLRVEVYAAGTSLCALQPGVSIDGVLLDPGKTVRLHGTAEIATPAGSLHFEQLHKPYVGLISGESGMRLAVRNGQTAEFGRKPNPPGLALTSDDSQENLRWCSGARAARARSNGFTLDRVLAGRRQGAVRVINRRFELVPLHEECPTFLLREGRMEQVSVPVAARFGDRVVTGTSVICIRAPA